MFRSIGAPEIILILLALILLFGAKKLPETARGLGRSLRIFKAETKGLRDDDDDAPTPRADAPRAIEPVATDRVVSEPVGTERPAVEDRSGSVVRERRAEDV
jgi:sec-independent protein translocase protein TatA